MPSGERDDAHVQPRLDGGHTTGRHPAERRYQADRPVPTVFRAVSIALFSLVFCCFFFTFVSRKIAVFSRV